MAVKRGHDVDDVDLKLDEEFLREHHIVVLDEEVQAREPRPWLPADEGDIPDCALLAQPAAQGCSLVRTGAVVLAPFSHPSLDKYTALRDREHLADVTLVPYSSHDELAAAFRFCVVGRFVAPLFLLAPSRRPCGWPSRTFGSRRWRG